MTAVGSVGRQVSRRAILRAVNALPPGRVTPPVVVPPATTRNWVTVTVHWNDGRLAQVPGVILKLAPGAKLVELIGPDGRRRREWFAAHYVRRQG